MGPRLHFPGSQKESKCQNIKKTLKCLAESKTKLAVPGLVDQELPGLLRATLLVCYMSFLKIMMMMLTKTLLPKKFKPPNR